MNKTMADFLAADISVTEISRVWRGYSDHWERPVKIPRKSEGLLLFFTGGNFYDFGDFSFEAKAGQVVRLPGGIPYGGHPLSDERLQFICIDFVTASSGEFLQFPLPMAWTPADPERAVREFEDLHERWSSHTLCGRLACKAALMAMMARLASEYACMTLHYDNRSRILKLTEYIRQMAPRSDFRLAEAAEHFFMSEAHLRRIFQAELHMSPSAYLTAVRMERARELLLDARELSVREVAEQSGYASVYYFSGVFHEQEGMSPSEFRKKGRLLL